MSDKITDKAIEYIESMSSAFTGITEHLYGVLIRQQIVEGVSNIVSAIFFIIVAIMSKILYKRYAEKVRGDCDDAGVYYAEEYLSSIRFALIICIGMLSILSVVLMTRGICHVLNPEYYAIKDLVETAVNGK